MPDTNLPNYGEYIGETSRGLGAVAGSNIYAMEYGNSAVHRTVLALTNRAVTVANTTGSSFGSSKLYDFPVGRILILGGRVNLTITWTGEDIAAGGSGDASLGTTATADATLDSTDADIMASTAMLDPFVSGVGTLTGNLVVPTAFDGTSTAKDLYFNAIIDDADVSDGASDTILLRGEISIVWSNLGNL